MSLNYLKNHFLNKKALFLYSIVLFYFFVFRDFAWAAPAATGEAKDVALSWLVDFLNLWIWVLTFLITPLIMLAGWLLSPDWTFWDIFNLRPVIHSIWILVSNFVYIIFAFVLVFIAFMNIFWENKNYAIKSSLPKLITAILIVPFTWFIVSFMLSISNFLVASVIQLPVETILKSTDNSNSFLKDPIIPKNITYDANYSSDENTNYTKEQFNAISKNMSDVSNNGKDKINVNWSFYTTDCENGKSWCISIEDLLTKSKWWAYNMLSVYAYWIFKIQHFKQIDKSELAWIKFIWELAKKLSFWIIFFVIFWVLVISIVYALFSRAVMLWLYAIFSPLFALTWFFTGKWWEGFKKLEKHMTIQKFISLALVPVYVSAALSFWLVFLSATMSARNWNNDATWAIKWDNVNITTNKETQTQTFVFWKEPTAVTFRTVWVLTKETTSGINTALDMWKWIISTIIINVLALVILWMAVMAALQSNEITWNAVKPIADFWASIWKLALEAPKYIPLKIPWPDWKSIKMSMAWLWAAWSSLKNAIETAATSSGSKMWTAFWEDLAQRLWLESDKNLNNLKEYNKNHKPDWTSKWDATYVESALKSYWKKFEDIVKSPVAREELWNTISNLKKISEDDKKKFIKELGEVKSNWDLTRLFNELDAKLWGQLWWSWNDFWKEENFNKAVAGDNIEKWIIIKTPKIEQPLSDKNTVVKIKWEIDGKKDQEKTIDIWLFKSWWNYYKTKDASWKFTDKVDNIKEHVSAKLSENWITPDEKLIWMIL